MVVRKVGSRFAVFSKSGKRLSKPSTRKAAVKRLGQIEFFKHRGKRK